MKHFTKWHPDSEDLFSLQLRRCDVLFGKTYFCFVSFVHAKALPRANMHISVFRTCATHPKVALVSSGTKASATLWKHWKGHVCLLLLFHEWQNLELLRGYPYFLNALLILVIFQNKYGRAVTVGTYDCTSSAVWNQELWCGNTANRWHVWNDNDVKLLLLVWSGLQM